MVHEQADDNADGVLLDSRALFSLQARTISGKIPYTIYNDIPEEGNLPQQGEYEIPRQSPQPRICEPCLKHTK
jgi:hypothetical protein